MPKPRGRRPFDFYETPPHYINALLARIRPRGVIVDPCVGRGNISKVLSLTTYVITNDLNPRHKAAFHLNAASHRFWAQLSKRRIDWVITNPPFRNELKILRQALHHADNVAMLARLSFLEPTLTRADFWQEHHQSVGVVVLPRYSFRKNDEGKRATDSMTCCWLIWEKRRAQSYYDVSLDRDAA